MCEKTTKGSRKENTENEGKRNDENEEKENKRETNRQNNGGKRKNDRGENGGSQAKKKKNGDKKTKGNDLEGERKKAERIEAQKARSESKEKEAMQQKATIAARKAQAVRRRDAEEENQLIVSAQNPIDIPPVPQPDVVTVSVDVHPPPTARTAFKNTSSHTLSTTRPIPKNTPAHPPLTPRNNPSPPNRTPNTTPHSSKPKSVSSRRSIMVADDYSTDDETELIFSNCPNKDCKALLAENSALRAKVKKLQERLDVAGTVEKNDCCFVKS